MGSHPGKTLSIVAGILTLIATYFLALYTFELAGSTFYVYGVGGFKAVLNMFTNVDSYAFLFGIPTWAVYIVAVVVILFLIAGIFQIIGAKSRATAIIGSILVLLVGVIIILDIFNILPMLSTYVDIMGDSAPLIDGIIPFAFTIPGINMSIGTIVLLTGGVLGFIGGCMGR
jgi:hypothetical protein